jgi:hypothetical protein
MLSLYQARLVRRPVPASHPLIVVALYDTVYATWRPHATWNRRGLGQFAPAHVRIPIDQQFGLGLLGGTLVPCPNTDMVAGAWRLSGAWRLFSDISNGFTARNLQVGNSNPNYYEIKLHCRKCNYRSIVPAYVDMSPAERRRSLRHPPGRTAVRTTVPEAWVPYATAGFDFARGCLINDDHGAVVVVYGSPRTRLTDPYLDMHLGPAKRSYHGRDGALYVARAG